MFFKKISLKLHKIMIELQSLNSVQTQKIRDIKNRDLV